MFRHSKTLLTRAALFAASFTTTALLMAGLGATFHGVSTEPWLRDSPSTRLALDRCLAQREGDPAARRDCVRRLVAEARTRAAAPVRMAAGQPAPAAGGTR